MSRKDSDGHVRYGIWLIRRYSCVALTRPGGTIPSIACHQEIDTLRYSCFLPES